MVDVALGTMNFGRRTDAAESLRIMARAVERGVGLFDTANVYVDGESERLVGRARRELGARFRIATKAGIGRIGKPEGLSAPVLSAAIDASLARLGVDEVDVFYLHAPDPKTPLTETIGAVAGILKSGKARAFGVSNYPAWEILEIRALCEQAGIAPPAMSQVLYNALVRQIEIEYVPFTRKYPVHTTVYNALAGGLLSGRYAPGSAVEKGSRFDGNPMYQRRYWTGSMLAAAARMAEVARVQSVTPAHLAYAWLASRPGVDSILVGPGTVAHLDAALDALSAPVPQAALDGVDEIYRDWQGTDARYAR
jgi:aryl-alcohol dehydrogenase-like predicted oxidoreductase